jgi:hypothetical protein
MLTPVDDLPYRHINTYVKACDKVDQQENGATNGVDGRVLSPFESRRAGRRLHHRHWSAPTGYTVTEARFEELPGSGTIALQDVPGVLLFTFEVGEAAGHARN